MKKVKPYILPVALALGLLLHSWVSVFTFVVPYAVFAILLLNFVAVDLRKLTFNRFDLAVVLFQTFVSLGLYVVVKQLLGNEDLAQGAMICVLCPIASSVVVVAAALGADRGTTTGYTIYGNLLVSALAPVYFSFIGVQQEMPFFESAALIFGRIAPVIALPYFIALFLQWRMPKVKDGLARFKEWALPIWAFVLLVVLGKTIDYIFIYHEGNEALIIGLAVIAAVVCAAQFWIGKLVGGALGDRISGWQLFGQKNTGIGIWMALIFLNPMSSVALAFYAIAQNLFNSWQMWVYARRH